MGMSSKALSVINDLSQISWIKWGFCILWFIVDLLPVTPAWNSHAVNHICAWLAAWLTTWWANLVSAASRFSLTTKWHDVLLLSIQIKYHKLSQNYDCEQLSTRTSTWFAFHWVNSPIYARNHLNNQRNVL